MTVLTQSIIIPLDSSSEFRRTAWACPYACAPACSLFFSFVKIDIEFFIARELSFGAINS